jgi:hypothetical protein
VGVGVDVADVGVDVGLADGVVVVRTPKSADVTVSPAARVTDTGPVVRA